MIAAGASLRTETLQVDDTEITVHRIGTGPTIVILHGLTGAATWYDLAFALADRHECIIPEHPGFAAPAGADLFDNVHDLAYFYLDFLEALAITDATILGQSTGGWIALEMAVRSVQRIARLVLSAPAGLKVRGPRGDLFMWSPEERIRRLFANQANAEAMLSASESPANLESSLWGEYFVARIGWDPPLYDPFLERWLRRIAIPVDFIWGTDDQLFPLAHGERIATLFRTASLRVIPDAGHLAHIDQPGLFLSAVSQAAEVKP